MASNRMLPCRVEQDVHQKVKELSSIEDREPGWVVSRIIRKFYSEYSKLSIDERQKLMNELKTHKD